ncbi:hypothetical protein QFC19_004045 [Naganishia cerealis]|uniref:Uncharacterized protein n=1 Tax=Naganishia cerealis TaxID=610337 RepID=A0ACC2VXT3_9TREE|nr:hypothetical protein QFC19_004045 [Naganishia cerealis]
MMNPFDDRQSIATHDEGDGQSFVSSSTNVIPIAFVPSHPTQASTPAPPPSDAQTALQVARERALVTGRLKVGTTPTPPSGLGSGGQGLGAGLTPTSAIAPSRPARSPDLDLRLVAPAPPPTTGNTMETLLPPDPRSRVSVTTTRSAAPSFLSGHSSASGMMVDPPVIVTSRHVQLGVRQAAEVVNFAAAAVEPFPLSAGRESFRRSRPQSAATALETYAPHGHHQQEDPFSDPPADALPSSSSSLSSSARSSATVTAPGGGGGGGGGADAAYRLQPQRSTATFGEPSPHPQEAGYVATTDAGGGGAATGDLRFSIGSLAASTRYDDGARDSVSTQGTSFVQPVGAIGEARRVLVGVAGGGGGGGGAMGGAPTAWQTRGSFSAFAAAAASTDQEADEAPAEEDYSIPLARPRPGFANDSPHQQQQYGGQGGGGGGGGGRESIMSSRSDDSFLNAIIPPKFTSPYAVTGGELSSPGRKMVGQLQYLPTSMSTDTFASPAAAGKSRTTTTTMGGSMTSPSPSPSKPPPSFPLSRAPTTTMGNAQASESRYTLGLSGFEFQIGDDDDDHVHDDESAREELPPMPLPSRTWSS